MVESPAKLSRGNVAKVVITGLVTCCLVWYPMPQYAITTQSEQDQLYYSSWSTKYIFKRKSTQLRKVHLSVVYLLSRCITNKGKYRLPYPRADL